jgi:hypothetical protein
VCPLHLLNFATIWGLICDYCHILSLWDCPRRCEKKFPTSRLKSHLLSAYASKAAAFDLYSHVRNSPDGCPNEITSGVHRQIFNQIIANARDSCALQLQEVHTTWPGGGSTTLKAETSKNSKIPAVVGVRGVILCWNPIGAIDRFAGRICL